ncbi:MAG TPA: hypothetical protein VE129_13475 [Thermoanaerobaculia bacterium]|nr:hypothetical protein [Thermoanaerobaculia bacterium]
MNPIFAAAQEIQEFCRARKWRFCIIGGLAVQRWGEPRFTRDVDLTLLTGFGNEPAFVDELLLGFRPRLADARDFALRNRVVLLASAEGVPIDIALGAMPFEEAAVLRATPYPVAPGVELSTCSAEDLVVFKAFAGRPRDWLDIEGIVTRQGASLDSAIVWRELLPLLELKEDEETEPRLRRLLPGTRSSA